MKMFNGRSMAMAESNEAVNTRYQEITRPNKQILQTVKTLIADKDCVQYAHISEETISTRAEFDRNLLFTILCS